MKINEIFISIQGEGQQQGELTTFIRTIGCNMRCEWCDTKYAYEGGKEMTVEEIVTEVASLGAKNICITGGEPLLQEDMPKLIDALMNNINYNIFVETNGSQFIGNYPKRKQLHWVLDFKLPSSGMYDKFDYKNLDHDIYEIKFVVADRKDYDIMLQFIKMFYTNDPNSQTKLLISPCWGSITKKKLAEWMIADRINARYSLQIHKVVWDKNKRGV